MSDAQIVLAEFAVATDAAGTPATLYAGSHGYTTSATDTPPHRHFVGRLSQPGNLKREIAGERFAGGAVRAGGGEVLLINGDGRLDPWIGYGFDGQPLTLRLGYPGASYPSAWATLLTGIAAGVEVGWNDARILVRDKLALLDKPLLTATYGGSNALPAGLDGVAGDLKGKPIPRPYGNCKNVTLPMVNTSRYIHQVADRLVAVSAVRHRGEVLTLGAAYASQADMETNAPAAGQVRIWASAGGTYARLGSQPYGAVTADVVEGTAAADRTCAQLLKRIALDMSIPAGSISSADVSALDTAQPAELGRWIDGTDTALQVMEEIAISVGVWFGFDRLGVLRMGRLEAPSGTPVATIKTHRIIKIDRVAPRESGELGGRGVPTGKITLGYARNWTQQTSDLAGAVAADFKAWTAEQYRTLVTTVSLAKHPLASVWRRDTLLADATAAQTEIARLMAMYGVERDLFAVTVRISKALANSIDLGAVIQLQTRRFGLGAGRLFRVVGIETDLRINELTLTVWG